MNAKKNWTLFRQKSSPKASQVRSTGINPLANEAAEILALLQKFFVDVIKSADEEIYEKKYAQSASAKFAQQKTPKTKTIRFGSFTPSAGDPLLEIFAP